MQSTERAKKIFTILKKTYPNAHCALHHSNPLELLVATILAAQCTDERVNKVTPPLFKKYRSAADYAKANLKELEKEVRSTGFYRQKAKSIKSVGGTLAERFHGKVPKTMEELVALPGVWRKTANVILNTAFGQPTIAVDTHIFRVGNRTGLARGKTPLAVELKLDKATPQPFRLHAHHWLILHGRYTCKARRPECWRCIVADLCAYKPKTPPPRTATA